MVSIMRGTPAKAGRTRNEVNKDGKRAWRNEAPFITGDLFVPGRRKALHDFLECLAGREMIPPCFL